MTALTDADLQYGDPTGDDVLKRQLADYLGRRARRRRRPEPRRRHQRLRPGAEPAVRACLKARGATRIALEDPSNPESRDIVARAGLEPVPVRGRRARPPGRRARRRRRGASSPPPTSTRPASSSPPSAARSSCSGCATTTRSRSRTTTTPSTATTARRSARSRGSSRSGSSTRARRARRSRPRCGSAGSSSRATSSSRSGTDKYLADLGTARIEQHAFADFIARGELDRHLRRMRARYRARRDALVEALRGGAARGDDQGHRRRAARDGRAAAGP